MLGKKKLVYILLSCISVIQISVFAQKATTKVTVQPFEIAIGQQATINLEVIAPKGNNIVFPVYPDTLVSGIEVLAMPKADTTYSNEVMTISQKYIVTSFDSALYHIPYIPVIDGLDTIRSNDFALKVVSPELSEATLAYLKEMTEQKTDSIDFNQLGLADIKSIQEPPFVWSDYLNYILLGLFILLVIIAIGIGIYLYYRKKKKGYFFKPVVVQPPHVIAINALNQIKDEKLWQQGREKEYYTELTDTLREYLERRYRINAFEKTSDEILSIVNGLIEEDSSRLGLKQILKLADLVKFAKYKPLLDENDLSLVNAFLFVNQTKKEEPEVIFDDEGNPINNKSESQDNSSEEEEIDWTISPKDKI